MEFGTTLKKKKEINKKERNKKTVSKKNEDYNSSIDWCTPPPFAVYILPPRWGWARLLSLLHVVYICVAFLNALLDM